MAEQTFNPLTFFWIAVYDDGTALPQFDPETGRENLFSQVDQNRLTSFGWYPFKRQLAEKLEQPVEVNPLLPKYAVKLGQGKRLIAHRTNSLNYGVKGKMELFEKSRQTIYIIGYEMNGEQFKIAIDERGNVIVGGAD
jgi:hypothetical protein